MPILYQVSCCEVVEAPNGELGIRMIGSCFIDAQAPIDLGGSTIEAIAPAAGFEEFWRQCTINGATGSEVYITLSDTQGNLQWHHLT